MASRYSIAEARAHLPSLVYQAESGTPVELTRRGEPVAVLVSVQEFERLRGQVPRFDEAYRQFTERHSLREVGVEPDFASTLRDRDPGRKVRL